MLLKSLSSGFNMEFIKLLKAGSIISGINWGIYLIHEWVEFAKNNPPEVVSEGDPTFLGLIAQSFISLALIILGISYKSASKEDAENIKPRHKPHLTSPPTRFTGIEEKPVSSTIPSQTSMQSSTSVTTPSSAPIVPTKSSSETTMSQPTEFRSIQSHSIASHSRSEKKSNSDRQIITILVVVFGLISGAIYYMKQKNQEIVELPAKAEPSEEKNNDPQPTVKADPVVTEPINKRWLGKWVDGNRQVSITTEALVITNLDTKTEVSFKWIGNEPTQNTPEPTFFYTKTISKGNLISSFDKYAASIANPNVEKINQFEQTKKMLTELSDGSYRVIQLRMSFDSKSYSSYIFDKDNIFKLDFDSQESLVGIAKYKKVNP